MSLRRILHAAYEHLAMVLGLGFLALLCLAWLPLAQLLHIVLPRRPPAMAARIKVPFSSQPTSVLSGDQKGPASFAPDESSVGGPKRSSQRHHRPSSFK